MIRRLSPEVRDQIAAGEVVERPAHLVKELIENSLDAGSTRVQIRVADSGRTLEVIDNGSGIPADQLSLALERFATSKIEKTEDLWALASFGFRGEALASAAAVSRLQITSRTRDAAQAFQLRSEFSRPSDVVEVSGEVGTRLHISQLFENVPARLKFLKSETAENQAIRQVVKAFALAHSQVEIKYFESEKLIFYFEGTKDWRQRCQAVLESQEELFEAQFSNEGWQANVVFASPQVVAKTSKQIWLFVQDRWVQDRSLQAAILDAYRSLLMHGEFPVVVLKLQVPTDQVDVNIHPTKSQVKFLNPSQAFRTVQHTLRQALEKAPWLKLKETAISRSFVAEPRMNFASQMNWTAQDTTLQQTQYKKKDLTFASHGAVEEVLSEVVTGGVWSRLEVIGQVGLTYILAQDEQGLVLVDQHAAHERVAFEKFMKAYADGGQPVQEFLFPLALDLTPLQSQALLGQKVELERLGVRLEELGPSTLGVTAAPLFVKESSLAAVLVKMADEILELGGSFQFSKKIIDICATLACHSVVRAGQSLSRSEMQSLLVQMDEFPLSSFCPHGRPVSVKWSLAELEKEFGRRN